MARNVAGDCATVTPLMGPGTDPHTYRASARDSRTFGSADLILCSGYALKGEFGDLLERIGERCPTLAVAEAVIPRAETIANDDQYGVGPHVWMDAALWGHIAGIIAESLAQLVLDCAAQCRPTPPHTARSLTLSTPGSGRA